jgi:GntR family transcriptional regulator/MocR family aminotransferase
MSFWSLTSSNFIPNLVKKGEAVILFQIDKNSQVPVYRQIIQKIIHFIDEGILIAGNPLPATRILAAKLEVNRSTVYRAYQELISLGYIESEPGSYTRVRKRIQPVPLDTPRKSRIRWSQRSTDFGRALYRTYENFHPEYTTPESSKDVINLSQLDLDPRLFPVDDFRRCINQVFSLHGSPMLQYGSYPGYAPLRKTISLRLRMHGISIAPDEILITSGAQQAIDLILRLLIRKSDTVAVEMPTYANFIPLLRGHQAEIMGIPMLEEGMDLEYFQRSMKKRLPALLYTIPNFHNPTGITTSQEHREKLLTLCGIHGIPIVEDGFEEDMKYLGRVVLPIKSIDHNGVVIYLGTFSKVLFPGIRIGWIAADMECIRRLTAIKRFTDISTNQVVQIALDQFIRLGYYDLNIRRLHRIFRKRMQHALSAMETYMPAHVTWTKPLGGYTIWVHLHNSVDENRLKQRMLANGVLVSHGSYFFVNGRHRDAVRLSISRLNEEEIEVGIKRFSKVLTDL